MSDRRASANLPIEDDRDRRDIRTSSQQALVDEYIDTVLSETEAPREERAEAPQEERAELPPGDRPGPLPPADENHLNVETTDDSGNTQRIAFDMSGRAVRFELRGELNLSFQFQNGQIVSVKENGQPVEGERAQVLMNLAQLAIESTRNELQIAPPPENPLEDLRPTEARNGERATGTLVYTEYGNLRQARVEDGVIKDGDGRRIGEFHDDGTVMLDGQPAFKIVDAEEGAFHGVGTDGARLDLVSKSWQSGFNGLLVKDDGSQSHTVIGGNIYSASGQFLGHLDEDGSVQLATTENTLAYAGVNSAFDRFMFSGEHNGKERAFRADRNATNGHIFLQENGRPRRYEVQMGMLIDRTTGEQMGWITPPQETSSAELTGGSITLMTEEGPKQSSLASLDHAAFELRELTTTNISGRTLSGITMGDGGTAGGDGGNTPAIFNVTQALMDEGALRNAANNKVRELTNSNSWSSFWRRGLITGGSGYLTGGTTSDIESQRHKSQEADARMSNLRHAISTGRIDDAGLRHLQQKARAAHEAVHGPQRPAPSVPESETHIELPQLADEATVARMNGRIRIGTGVYTIRDGVLFDAKADGSPAAADAAPRGKVLPNYQVQLGDEVIPLVNETRVLMQFQIGDNPTQHRVVGFGPGRFTEQGYVGGLLNVNELSRQVNQHTQHALAQDTEYLRNRPYLTGSFGDAVLGGREEILHRFTSDLIRQSRVFRENMGTLFANGFDPSFEQSRYDGHVVFARSLLTNIGAQAADTERLSQEGQQLQRQINDGVVIAGTTVATMGLGTAFAAAANTTRIANMGRLGMAMMYASEIGAGTLAGGTISVFGRASDSSDWRRNFAVGAMEGMTMSTGSAAGRWFGRGLDLQKAREVVALSRTGAQLTQEQAALLASLSRSVTGRMAASESSRLLTTGARGLFATADATIQTTGFSLASTIHDDKSLSEAFDGQTLSMGTVASLFGQFTSARLPGSGVLREQLETITDSAVSGTLEALLPAFQEQDAELAARLGVPVEKVSYAERMRNRNWTEALDTAMQSGAWSAVSSIALTGPGVFHGMMPRRHTTAEPIEVPESPVPDAGVELVLDDSIYGPQPDPMSVQFGGTPALAESPGASPFLQPVSFSNDKPLSHFPDATTNGDPDGPAFLDVSTFFAASQREDFHPPAEPHRETGDAADENGHGLFDDDDDSEWFAHAKGDDDSTLDMIAYDPNKEPTGCPRSIEEVPVEAVELARRMSAEDKPMGGFPNAHEFRALIGDQSVGTVPQEFLAGGASQREVLDSLDNLTRMLRSLDTSLPPQKKFGLGATDAQLPDFQFYLGSEPVSVHKVGVGEVAHVYRLSVGGRDFAFKVPNDAARMDVHGTYAEVGAFTFLSQFKEQGGINDLIDFHVANPSKGWMMVEYVTSPVERPGESLSAIFSERGLRLGDDWSANRGPGNVVWDLGGIEPTTVPQPRNLAEFKEMLSTPEGRMMAGRRVDAMGDPAEVKAALLLTLDTVPEAAGQVARSAASRLKGADLAEVLSKALETPGAAGRAAFELDRLKNTPYITELFMKGLRNPESRIETAKQLDHLPPSDRKAAFDAAFQYPECRAMAARCIPSIEDPMDRLNAINLAMTDPGSRNVLFTIYPANSPADVAQRERAFAEYLRSHGLNPESPDDGTNSPSREDAPEPSDFFDDDDDLWTGNFSDDSDSTIEMLAAGPDADQAVRHTLSELEKIYNNLGPEGLKNAKHLLDQLASYGAAATPELYKIYDDPSVTGYMGQLADDVIHRLATQNPTTPLFDGQGRLRRYGEQLIADFDGNQLAHLSTPRMLLLRQDDGTYIKTMFDDSGAEVSKVDLKGVRSISAALVSSVNSQGNPKQQFDIHFIYENSSVTEHLPLKKPESHGDTYDDSSDVILLRDDDEPFLLEDIDDEEEAFSLADTDDDRSDVILLRDDDEPFSPADTNDNSDSDDDSVMLFDDDDEDYYPDASDSDDTVAAVPDAPADGKPKRDSGRERATIDKVCDLFVTRDVPQERFDTIISMFPREDQPLVRALINETRANTSDMPLIAQMQNLNEQLKQHLQKLGLKESFSHYYTLDASSPGNFLGYLFRKANNGGRELHALESLEQDIASVQTPDGPTEIRPVVIFDDISSMTTEQREMLARVQRVHPVAVVDVTGFGQAPNVIDFARGEDAVRTKMQGLLDRARAIREARPSLRPSEVARLALTQPLDHAATDLGTNVTVLRPPSPSETSRSRVSQVLSWFSGKLKEDLTQLFAKADDELLGAEPPIQPRRVTRESIEAFINKHPADQREELIELLAAADYNTFATMTQKARALHEAIQFNAHERGINVEDEAPPLYVVGVDGGYDSNPAGGSGALVSYLYGQANNIPPEQFVTLPQLRRLEQEGRLAYTDTSGQARDRRVIYLDDTVYSGSQVNNSIREKLKGIRDLTVAPLGSYLGWTKAKMTSSGTAGNPHVVTIAVHFPLSQKSPFYKNLPADTRRAREQLQGGEDSYGDIDSFQIYPYMTPDNSSRPIHRFATEVLGVTHS